MTTEKFAEDLQRAHLELKAAIAEVMRMVNERKAFGAHWQAALERERKAHQTMKWLLDSPLARLIGNGEARAKIQGNELVKSEDSLGI